MQYKVNKNDVFKLLNDTRIFPSLRNLRWHGRSKVDKDFYLVAALPKSGSTWVTNVLANSIDCQVTRYCYAWSSNEHDLYLPALLANSDVCSIAQMHIKATPHNILLMSDFNFKTLVLTRNVYDSTVSFARDLMKKKTSDASTSGLTGYSFVWLKNYKDNWDLNDYIEYTIDYYLPWYMNFLSSWLDYKDEVSAKVVRYESLRSNPKIQFEKIISEFDDGKKLSSDFKENKINSNELISGTNSDVGAGFEILSSEQRDRIERFFSIHEDQWVLSHLRLEN